MAREGEFEEGILTKKETRREFLGDFAKLGTAAAAEEVARHLVGLNITQAAMVEAEKTVEPQIDLPPGTYLTSQSEWLLKTFKKVPEDVLIQYNGPKSAWSLPELGGLFLVPNSYFDGKDGMDRWVKGKLADKVIFRADVARDETTDEGWIPEEQKLVQGLLPMAARRSGEFFGQSRFNGFVRVSRPGKERREALRQQLSEYENAAGAVAGGSQPGTLQISILTSFAEYAGQNTMKNKSQDQIAGEYTGMLKDLLCHEIGHVWFLDTKLGFLDNHTIIRVLETSTGLIDLIDKSPEEIRKINYNDVHKPEMAVWKAYKVKTGREFYADLLTRLERKYGKKQEYSDDQVLLEANGIFLDAGFSNLDKDFPFTAVYATFDSIPNESSALKRSTEGYRYPIEKVARDQYNPDGMVSWWTEYKTPSPTSFDALDMGFVNQPHPFPDKEGYYSVYKFMGNGKLKDGPPGGNSAAVASWMKGGSLSGGDVLFPIGMMGMEMIRAEKK